MALLPTFPWAELRHVGTLSHYQRNGQEWDKQILLGTIATEKRDLSMEVGSTPSTAGQEGFYSQGAGGGQWVENS